jgi:hypothetical protein
LCGGPLQIDVSILSSAAGGWHVILTRRRHCVDVSGLYEGLPGMQSMVSAEMYAEQIIIMEERRKREVEYGVCKGGEDSEKEGFYKGGKTVETRPSVAR